MVGRGSSEQVDDLALVMRSMISTTDEGLKAERAVDGSSSSVFHKGEKLVTEVEEASC